ncbi:MAG: ASKHA domain-containing protein [Anaerolineales bacterium]
MNHFIHFEPVGLRGEVQAGRTLLDHARTLGVDLVNLCGGTGACGRCIVQVLNGEVSKPTTVELELLPPQEIDLGYRLACSTVPHGNCKVLVPPESLTSPQRLQVEGEELPVDPNPLAQAYHVHLTPPNLNDLKSDAERLIDALKQQHDLGGVLIDIDVLRLLSPLLRECVDPSNGKWHVKIITRELEIIGLLQPDVPPLGLAIDLGTTKIALYLLDLCTGRTLAFHGFMNPQIAYGEDIISRIAYTERDESNAALPRELVVKALNENVAEMCARVDAKPSHISDTVVVGNTAMHHIFLGLPLKQLARAPYVPAVTSALDLKARDVGLTFMPGSYIHLMANVAGYVGGDHVAMLLATEVDQQQGVTLAIDIGTNTEICLLNKGTLTSTSCASGPAFEGAHIKHGMRAASGAIEHLRLVEDRLEYQTIGGVPPVGLCGSGILDAMAQLYLAGVIDKQGHIRDHPRVRTVGGIREFILVDQSDLPHGLNAEASKHTISITQQDVRQLQLAKGAMHTGIELLLDANELRMEDIDQVIVAGAFGTYIDIASAITIGMLPELPLDRFRQVGNAAGMGAKIALISRTKRTEARTLAERTGYLELATHPQFHTTFAQSMFIGQHR